MKTACRRVCELQLQDLLVYSCFEKKAVDYKIQNNIT